MFKRTAMGEFLAGTGEFLEGLCFQWLSLHICSHICNVIATRSSVLVPFWNLAKCITGYSIAVITSGERELRPCLKSIYILT